MFNFSRKVLIHLLLTVLCLKEIPCLRVSTAPLEEALEGDKAVLRCIYSDENFSDTLFVILWQKFDPLTGRAETVYNSQNPHDEKHSDGRLKQVGVASLQFSPVYKTDSGKYRCQVTPLPSFEQGEAETELVVKYLPVFTSATNTTQYISNNDDLQLPCHANGLPEDIHYRWYFRKVHLESSNTHEKLIDPNEDPRLWFVKGKNLHLSDFSESFEGVFRCEARNDVGSSSSYFYLYLKRPATYIQFPKEAIKVIEGNDVTIAVSASAVPNNITFKWFYQGQEIDLFGWSNVFGFEGTQIYPFLRISQISDTISQLEIKDVTRTVAGEFTSSIFNNVGQPSSVKITLDVLYPPSLTLLPAPAYTVVEGSAVALACGGVGNPAPYFQWETPALEKVSSESDERGGVRFTVLRGGNFTVFPIFRNDTGKFTCTAGNGIGAQQQAFADVTVLYPPTMLVQPSPSYELDIGENLTLTCNTTGLPIPKYTWYKDHIPIRPRFEVGPMVDASLLRINGLSRQHKGVYRCQAENRFGMVFAESLVQIRYPPTITVLSSVRRVLIGDDVNVTCTVSGYPLPHVEWSHSARSSDVRIASVIRNGTRGRTFISTFRVDDSTVQSTLMLTRVGLRDCGLYYCAVDNVVGTDKGFTELRCTDLPPVPTDVVITHVTESGFVVTWQLENHIPNGERFMMELSQSDDVGPPVTVPCDTTSCRVTSLEASTGYSVRVFGVNSAGRGEKSVEKFVETKETPRTIPATSIVPPPSTREHTTTPSSETTNNTTEKPVYGNVSTSSGDPALHATTQSSRGFGIRDIVYNSTDGWVRWRLESSYENRLLSWNSSSLQRCVKVEARSSNRENWHVVAWCIAAWAEVCSLNLPTSVEWQVRVNLCRSINVGCGTPVPALTVSAVKAPEATKTVPTEAASEGFPVAAVVSASLALLLIIVAYVITYRHFRSRRRKMDDYDMSFELRRPGARLFRHHLDDRRARAFQASIDYLRSAHRQHRHFDRRSRSLPGHSRRWEAI